ncbi:MAG TPA: sigma-54 dependent transcriptional regulator [Polyangiaceae bacterium]|nr:sigma-54 dependent transcriptional regulator [Polyangiaceae bacterium]
MRARILVIDDDRSMCELLSEGLGAAGYDVISRLDAEAAVDLLREQDVDVIISDLNLQGTSGIGLCQRVRENRPNTPVIVITGFGDMRAAIDAIRAGASDFFDKPIDMTLLVHAIERALRERHLREQIRRLKQADVPPAETLGSMIGASRAMRDVYDLVRRVADSDTTVLLSGESGTGKELVAKALHELSGRPGRFVGVNCAAMPSELLESELFGHVRGAFTDAKSEHEGLFEQAGEGTLLLDEIGEMPLDLQPKLLRVLQERQLRPVGGNGMVPVRARIIAATNRDLEGEVEARRFREDLFYRLNVVQIHVPPLRARGNDVLLLADHFVQRFAARGNKSVRGIDSEAQRKLLAFDWPGNVRQLENSMERAVALTRSEQVLPEDLPERVVRFDANARAVNELDLEHVLTLDQVERRQIERSIRQHHGNKTRAAKALGIDRRTLYRKLERYDGAPPLPTQAPTKLERGAGL